MSSSTYAVLPPLYARWMDEMLPGPIEPESNATCADCAMCRKSDDDVSQSGFWDPNVKCCSYQPRLANYLVGGALLDEPGDDPIAIEGRAQLEARLDAGIGVTPLGVMQNPAYMMLYKGSQGAFGRAHALRCPHWVDVNGGMCGIWRHRESTCATFFCKHVRGAVGKTFWNAVHQVLTHLENNLAIWCLLELQVDLDIMKKLLAPSAISERDRVGPEQLDGRIAGGIPRQDWGSWHGRERDFYRECARKVQALTWEQVVAICGPGLQALVQLARQAYAGAHDATVPTHLGMAMVQIVRATSRDGQRVARISSYSANDPLILPERLANVLHRFDGTRSTNDVMFDIVAEEKMGINRALVRRLMDFGVLVEVQKPAVGA